MKSFFEKLIGKPARPASVDLLWLEQLAETDDISAIDTSTQHLRRYDANEAIDATERLRVLLAVDQENRHRLRKLTAQYVEFQNIRPDLETRLLDTLYFYHRQIFIGYRSLTRQFFDTTDDIIFPYNRLPLIIGRALLAAYAMMLCRYFRHQAAADLAWSEVFELFLILERESLLDLTVPLYRGEMDCHLAAGFVRAAMLDSLGQSGLTGQQLWRAVLLLEKWVPWIKISQHYDAQKHLYYVDLSKDHGARRIRLFEPVPSCRYWETEPLAAKIESAIEALDQDLPHDLDDIGGSVELLEILTLLRVEWSKTAYRRQRRSEERQKVVKSASVCYGFRAVSERIKGAATTPAQMTPDAHFSLDDRLHKHTVIRGAPTLLYENLTQERWMISDESSSGYGVIVSDSLNPEIRLGKLVGLLVEGRQPFIVGTIRSIQKMPNGQHHVGIKILSRRVHWVQLSHLQDSLQGGTQINAWEHAPASLLGFSGLYLPIEPGLSNWPSLLLPRAEFTANSSYLLNDLGKKSIVPLEAAQESKDDWVRVSYPE